MPFGPGVPDLEDLYLIFITDPVDFSATTVGPATGFNTQLWLFRAEPGGALDGRGLLGNDDASAADEGSTLLPVSTDMSGAVLTTAGLYYLGVSGGAALGDPGPGRVPAGMGAPIFFLAVPTEISGPDGPGEMFPLDDVWLGEGAVGSYTIALEGVIFVELPSCPWDCEPAPEGTVGIVDFLTLLSQWAAPTAPSSSPLPPPVCGRWWSPPRAC